MAGIKKKQFSEDDILKEFSTKTKKKVLTDTKYKSYTLTDRGTALAMGIELHLKARKLLFKIMERRIESWWD